MATTKPEAANLTVQGKGMPGNDVPPQTIIPSISYRKNVDMLNGTLKMAIKSDFRSKEFVPGKAVSSHHVQPLPSEHIIPTKVDGGAEGITPLSDERIDDIAGTFYGDGISVVDRQFARKIEEAHGIGGPKIIPTNFDGDGPGEEDGPWAKGWEDRVGGPGIIRVAEQRRQTVQAEAMVNLAVGVVAAKMSTHGFQFTHDAKGKPDKFRIAVSPQELLDFQRLYTVTQEIKPDGGFIISVTPKEV